jgi:hypothetical protein
MSRIFLFLAAVLGLSIAYVDSRPGWDDTGVTAVALFASGALCGALAPGRPWLWGLAVGAWTPIVGIAREGNYGSLLALVFAFAGAYAGMAVRRTVWPA